MQKLWNNEIRISGDGPRSGPGLKAHQVILMCSPCCNPLRSVEIFYNVSTSKYIAMLCSSGFQVLVPLSGNP